LCHSRMAGMRIGSIQSSQQNLQSGSPRRVSAKSGRQKIKVPHADLYKEITVRQFLNKVWNDEQGQDIAEYAVMLAVILVIVIGTVRLIGTNANTVFSQVGSAIQ